VACWQYSAIDVASSYVWAEVWVTPKNPTARYTSAPARRVAADLADHGWELKKVSSDNGTEFRSVEFTRALQALGAEHAFIRAGRPRATAASSESSRPSSRSAGRPPSPAI
jgi:transposase InsO family protein